MQRLATDHNDLISIEVRRYMRDVLDHHIHAADRIVSYDDMLSSLVQAALGKVAMQQNIDMRKISAWVAIAAVPTAVAGIYGMNFEHMPELKATWGYPAVAPRRSVCSCHRTSATAGCSGSLSPRAYRVGSSAVAPAGRFGSSTSTPSSRHAFRIASTPLSRTHAASVGVIGVAARNSPISRSTDSQYRWRPTELR